MSMMLCGTGVSTGIAIGRVALATVAGGSLRLDRPAQEPALEQQRLTQAIHAVAAALTRACTEATRWPREVQAIVEGHRLILEDDAFRQPILAFIAEHRCSAEKALLVHQQEVVDSLQQVDDAYVAARRDDLEGLFARVLSHLTHQANGRRGAPEHAADGPAAATAGTTPAAPIEGGIAGGEGEGCILVCADPAPTDLLLPRTGRVTGVVSERGGHLSHTTIVARSLRLPYVAGVAGVSRVLHEGELVILDGASGLVLVEPDVETLRIYRERQRSQQHRWRSLQAHPLVGPVATRDGTAVEIMTNVRGPQDLDDSRRLQVDGVGLYRTEFLYANRTELPGEEEHYATYRQLCEGLDGHPVTIRTLDTCAGPQLQALGLHLPRSAQPALGLRAIRLCLQYPELFAPQIRALLRAACHGPLRILLPMISTIGELEQAMAFIEDCRQALVREGIACADHVPVGAMIEVPAAALCAPALADAASFLSIGTNDLIQYTLAIDRDDEAVQRLYDPANPAVLRLINGCLAAARQAHVPVSLCGEMAGDPHFTRLLLGLGLTSFSMRPNAVPEVKRIVAATDLDTVRADAKAILDSHCPARSRELLDALNAA